MKVEQNRNVAQESWVYETEKEMNKRKEAEKESWPKLRKKQSDRSEKQEKERKVLWKIQAG